MTRDPAERFARVRRLLEAARTVYEQRAAIAPAIAACTGLSLEGVAAGFECLERGAGDDELRALVASAGDATEVHVILSANVFVAPLRAIALACAAAARVTVRPSSRDPTLAQALVQAAADEGLILVRDGRALDRASGEVHVYGRDETVAAVRARVRPGVAVRGHRAGLGLALISRRADLASAAEALSHDVVLFDQRGCLSPRIALVEGGSERARDFALALHDRLGLMDVQVPRGKLSDDERRQASAWRDTLAFAGDLWAGAAHAVGWTREGDPLAVPPPGRHIQVAAFGAPDEVAAKVARLARYVVAVGSDDGRRFSAVIPAHARISGLGLMQRPPLDGPVDRRVS